MAISYQPSVRFEVTAGHLPKHEKWHATQQIRLTQASLKIINLSSAFALYAALPHCSLNTLSPLYVYQDLTWEVTPPTTEFSHA